MAKPNPHLGLVIRYDYLWKSEQLRGRTEGSKERPCAVVIGLQDPLRAIVCGITHTEPDAAAEIEIPAKVRSHLGLDGDRQWVITCEVNVVEWDDPGIVPLTSGQWAYGDLPPELAKAVHQSVLSHLNAKQLAWIKRAE